MVPLGSLFLAFGIAASFEPAHSSAPAPSVIEKRTVFGLVRPQTDLSRLCGGETPRAVEVRRTAADVASAVFTWGMYTPVHVRVICASGF